MTDRKDEIAEISEATNDVEDLSEPNDVEDLSEPNDVEDVAQVADVENVGDTTAEGPRQPPGRLLTVALLPIAATASAAAAGYLGWQYASTRDTAAAATDSVAAARETTIAMLTYRADTAEQELTSVRDRLTGTFLDSYTKLINDVVIPGAKEKKVTAVAEVPEAASVSATAKHAVALVFVNQTVAAGDAAPTATKWSVRVTLDKVDGRWLVAGFDPV